MNKLAIKALDVLYDFCTVEGYKIIDAEDILAHIEGVSAEELFEIIDNLNTAKFVAVKYSDKTEYCLALTKTGKTLIEEEREIRANQERIKSEKLAKEEAIRQERIRLEELEKERLEAEAKNKKGTRLKFRKKDVINTNDNITNNIDSVALENVEAQDINYDSQYETVLSEDTDSTEILHDNKEVPSTIVLREVMLNRETMKIIARVAFFSGFIGAVIGSLIISLIFVFI